MSTTHSENSITAEISGHINQTLCERQKFAKVPEGKIQLLTALEEKLKAFKTGALQQYIANTEDNVKKSLISLEQELDTYINDGRISAVRKKLSEVQQRFQRDSLCVAIVGNKGQGKSKFLQGVTGLGDDIIPTGTGRDTTGAQMVFINDVQSSAVKAVLHLYQDNEFLEIVVKPLFSFIGLPAPNNFSDFLSYSKEKLEEKKEKNPELVSTIERLQQDYPVYKNYLKGGTKDISREDIRDWTAKHDVADNPLTKWMAVKLAEIHCGFPKLAGVKVSVADTPGLGDSYVPKEGDKLRENFTARVDDVCIFRRIGQKGLGQPDDNLYGIVDEAIGELDVAEWTHFLVNVFESEKKDSTAQGMLETLRKCFDTPSSRFSKLKHRYHEVSVCKGEPPVLDSEAVLDVFKKIVEDMSQNQAALDKKIFDQRFNQVKPLVDDIADWLQKVGKVAPKDDAALPQTELTKLFHPCWVAVTKELKSLVDEKRKIRDDPDKELEALIDAIEKETIQEAATYLNGIKGDEIPDDGFFVLDTYHNLRVMLSIAFDKLDSNLEAHLKTVRQKVVTILCEHGKLNQLFPEESLSADAYLEKLAESWETIKGGDKISEVIRQFVKITFSFRAYLLPKIRNTINPIDFESGEAPALESGAPWDKNRKIINPAFDNVMKECAKQLKELTREKNMAVFAIIDQFRDGFLHTGGYLHAKDIWLAFYNENRDAIWVEAGDKVKNRRKIKRDWEIELGAVQEAINAIRGGRD